MAIKWFFYRDNAGQCRWEVRGAGGPIATSGRMFDSLDDCVADARERGFTGPANPVVSSSPVATAHESPAPKHAAR